jgi:ABC-2 type transport system permease protein
MVAQLVTSLATGALVLPVMVLYGLALWSDPAWGIAALALGLVGGGVVLAAGVVLGGRVHDRRSVRVLARLA